MTEKIELKLVDVYEYEGNKAVFQTDNCYVIIIDVVKGIGLIKDELNKNLKFNEGINQLFRERDIELDENTGYLDVIWDAKDTFTGDQEMFMKYINDIVSDTKDELNQLFS